MKTNNNETNNLINVYLELVANYLARSTDANVDALEEFVAEHPGIEDAAYQAGGPYEYDIITGTVYTKAA